MNRIEILKHAAQVLRDVGAHDTANEILEQYTKLEEDTKEFEESTKRAVQQLFEARLSIGGGFLWHKTPQGALFWSRVSNSIQETIDIIKEVREE